MLTRRIVSMVSALVAFVNGALVGSDSSAPFEVTRGDLPTGMHHVVARVVAGAMPN